MLRIPAFLLASAVLAFVAKRTASGGFCRPDGCWQSRLCFGGPPRETKAENRSAFSGPALLNEANAACVWNRHRRRSIESVPVQISRAWVMERATVSGAGPPVSFLPRSQASSEMESYTSASNSGEKVFSVSRGIRLSKRPAGCRKRPDGRPPRGQSGTEDLF